MEKVVAYKAFNGRLFDTEEKCLAYEKKIAQYPKIKETISNADNEVIGGTEVQVDVVEHTIQTKEKPSSQIKKETYYIVGGKYKLTGCYFLHMKYNVLTAPEKQIYGDYAMADRAVARHILNGNKINLNELERIATMFKMANKYSKMTATEIVPNQKWKIEDIRWQQGSIKPIIITIEKIV